MVKESNKKVILLVGEKPFADLKSAKSYLEKRRKRTYGIFYGMPTIPKKRSKRNVR